MLERHLRAACAVLVLVCTSLAYSDDQNLLDQYVAAATHPKLIETNAAPTIGGTASKIYTQPDEAAAAALDHARAQLVQRGSAIVPVLLQFLEQEQDRDRGSMPDGQPVDLSGDVLHLLSRIGDASAVLPLLDFYEAREHSFTMAHAIRNTLETLTYVTFFSSYAFAVHEPSNASHPIAQRYRHWISEHGLDRAHWHTLAIQRARALMATDDRRAINGALAFLQAPIDAVDAADTWHVDETGAIRTMRDDDPARTTARLAELTSQIVITEPMRLQGTLFGSPVNLSRWVERLCLYGTHVQPHAQVLIDLHHEVGLNWWGIVRHIGNVGGDELMEHLVRAMPIVQREVDLIRLDPSNQGQDPNSAQWINWIHAKTVLATTFDKLAGREFDDDTQRMKWWKEDRDQASSHQ